jgi:hypothetical protein
MNGVTASFRDLADPKKLTRFEFCCAEGKGSKQEITGPIGGPLWWGQGCLKTTLNRDDVIKFNGSDNGSKGNQIFPYVAAHLPIKYLPSDGTCSETMWGARGCAILLNEIEKVFGSKITVELLYLGTRRRQHNNKTILVEFRHIHHLSILFLSCVLAAEHQPVDRHHHNTTPSVGAPVGAAGCCEEGAR